MEKFIFVLIYKLHVDNTRLLNTDSTYCFSTTSIKRKREGEKEAPPRRYVKLVFCLVLQF